MLTAAVHDDSPEPLHHADIAPTPEPYQTGDRKQGLGAVPPGGIPATPVPTFTARLSMAAETPDAQACHTGGGSSTTSSHAHTAHKPMRLIHPTLPEDAVFTPAAAGHSAFQPCSAAHSPSPSGDTAPGVHSQVGSTQQSVGHASADGCAADPDSAGSTRGTPGDSAQLQGDSATPASPDSQVRRLFHTQAPAASPLVTTKAVQAGQLGLFAGLGLVAASPAGGSPTGPADTPPQHLGPPNLTQLQRPLVIVA